MKRLSVVGVRLELPTNSPLVLLQEESSDRYLPIWIGPAEATAIAVVSDPPEQPLKRPLTHDLYQATLDALEVPLNRIEITDLEDSVFYATLFIGDKLQVEARPSDAIAIAVRMGTPIYCAEEVLEEAAIFLPDGDGDDTEQETEVRKFREFLDNIDPEDFMK